MASSFFDPSAQTATFLSLADHPPAPAGGITSRTLLQTPTAKSVLFAFDADQELTEHTNPNHAILHGLTGEVRVTAGAAMHALGPGDMLHLPPNMPHAVKAATSASFLLQLLSPTS